MVTPLFPTLNQDLVRAYGRTPRGRVEAQQQITAEAQESAANADRIRELMEMVAQRTRPPQPGPSALERGLGVLNFPFERVGQPLLGAGLGGLFRMLPGEQAGETALREAVRGNIFAQGGRERVQAALEETRLPRGAMTALRIGFDPLTFVPTGGLAVRALRGIGQGARALTASAKTARTFVEEFGPRAPVVEKFYNALLVAKPLPKLAEQARHAERVQRVARGAATEEQLLAGGGAFAETEALRAARTAQVGQMPLRTFTTGAEFTAEEVNALKGVITDKFRAKAISYYDQLNAEDGLDKILLGQVPQRSEVVLLERIYGTKVAEALIKALAPPTTVETILAVANIPRATLASVDASMVLRQSIIPTLRHPLLSAANTGSYLKALVNPRFAGAQWEKIQAEPLFREALDAGVPLLRPGSVASELSVREEAFMTTLAQRLPGLGSLVKASERGAMTFLNGMRMDLFKKTYNDWIRKGQWLAPGTAVPSEEAVRTLASYINIATGRGDLRAIQWFRPGLNAAFFSPGLLISRVQMPLMLRSKYVRGLVAQDLVAFVGTGMAVMAGLKAAGATVGTDPRSSEFGKVKVGPTRIDFWGGYQQIARYTAQAISGQTLTAGGELRETEAKGVIGRFVRSKVSPPVGFLWDAYTGETFAGRDVELIGAPVQRLGYDAYERLTPLFLQDLASAVREHNGKGIFIAAPGFFGANVSTYKTLPDVREYESMRLFGMSYKELDTPAKRNAVNQQPSVEEIRKEFERVTPPSERASTLLDSWRRVKLEQEARLHTAIQAGAVGGALRSAIQEFRQERALAAEFIIDDDIRQYLQKDNQALSEILAEGYWSLEAPQDPESQLIDFRALDQDRERVLQVADAVGVPRDFIQVAYRQGRFADPLLNRVVGEYERDFDQLRDYYDIPWNLAAEFEVLPEYRQFLEAEKRSRGLGTEIQRRNPTLRRVIRLAARERRRVRLNSPAVDGLLQKWGITKVQDEAVLAGVGG